MLPKKREREVLSSFMTFINSLLYECYVWRDPITEENVISKYIVQPISVKAGYLNEPLAYRLTAFQTHFCAL
jgi:hypothetical protein